MKRTRTLPAALLLVAGGLSHAATLEVVRSKYLGYQHFLLGPVFPKDLEWAKAEVPSPYGKISSAWKRKLQEKVNFSLQQENTKSLPNNKKNSPPNRNT